MVWTCAECAAQGREGSNACVVCGAERPMSGELSAEPVAGRHSVAEHPAQPQHPAPPEYPAQPQYPEYEEPEYPEYEDYGPAPQRVRTGGRSWAIWAVAALAAAAIGIFTAFQLIGPTPAAAPEPGDGDGEVVTAARTATSLPTSTPTVEPTRDTVVGLVTIDPLAAADDRGVAVATMFEAYFRGINTRDIASTMVHYDPAGVINPNDTAQVTGFAQAVSTTTDTDIVLHRIGTADNGVQAVVTFRSQQAPGYGPKGRPNEACTAWDITYTLSGAAQSHYRILGSNATNRPC
jgi:hypothetical protein